MRACGDQIGDGAAGITTGDQTLADENGVGARAGVGQQVGGTADTRFGDADDVVGSPGAMRAKQSRSTSRVLRSRALTPITLAPACSARSASSSVCTSTSAVMPERLGAIEHRHQRVLLERRDDQQQHVGAVRAGLVDLIRADDEVLAQHRD